MRRIFIFILLILSVSSLVIILSRSGYLLDRCAHVEGLGPGGDGWDANLEPAKDLCYLDRAKKENKIELCEKTGEMKYDCITDIASITKNEKLCTGRLRDNCLYDIAEYNKDIGFCHLISSTGFKNSCIQHVATPK